MATWAILNSGCATGGVTQVDPCVEIPFLDAAEGACTNTVTHQAYLVPPDEWLKLRPTMIMLRASDWTKIKKDWLRACRMMNADGGKCVVAVESIDKAISQLERITETVMELPNATL